MTALLTSSDNIALLPRYLCLHRLHLVNFSDSTWKHLKNLIIITQVSGLYNSSWRSMSRSVKTSNSWWWRPTITRGRYPTTILKLSAFDFCCTQTEQLSNTGKSLKRLSSLHSSPCSSCHPQRAWVACKQSFYLQLRERTTFFKSGTE